MNQQAPYIRMKDFDHEDVEVEFSVSKTLNVIAMCAYDKGRELARRWLV